MRSPVKIINDGIMRVGGHRQRGPVQLYQPTGLPNKYAFKMPMTSGVIPKDLRSKNTLTTNLPGVRYDTVNGVHTEFAVDEPVITELGLRGGGVVENLVWPSEDLSSLSLINDASFLDGTITLPTVTDIAAIPNTTINNFLVGATHTLGLFGIVGSGALILSMIRIGGSYEDTQKIITLSDIPQDVFLSFTFDYGDHTGMVVNFRSASNSVPCTIDHARMMLHQGTYPLPYVPTTTAPVTTVTEAGSADYGNYLENLSTDFPQLYDVLDGEADGVELGYILGQTIGTPTINANIITFKDEASYASDSSAFDINGCYLITATVSNYIGTGFIVLPYDGTNDKDKSGESLKVAANGTYTYRYIPTRINFGVYSYAGHTATITINSVQKISPAAGELHVDWTPLYEPSVLGLEERACGITVTSNSAGVIYHQNVNNYNLIRSYDNTKLSYLTKTTKANTTYELCVVFGNSPTEGNSKFRVGIRAKGTTTWTWGSYAAFDGSFNPTDVLNFFWGNEWHSYLKNFYGLKANVYGVPPIWQPTIPSGYSLLTSDGSALTSGGEEITSGGTPLFIAN